MEYTRCGYGGSFELFTCHKADIETVAWEGLWIARDLISIFSRTKPFSSRFSSHIRENLSISSFVLTSIQDGRKHVRQICLIYAILMWNSFTFTFPYNCMASTMSSFLLFTPNRLIQWFISNNTSLTTTTKIHRSVKNSFLALQHAVTLAGYFLTNWQAVYKWQLSLKKITLKTVTTISVYRC